MPVVVKIGSSSLTGVDAKLDLDSIAHIVGQIVGLWDAGHPTVLVTSGAVAAGLTPLGLDSRPRDIPGLQVAAAVGQSILMGRLSEEFARHSKVIGQILLTRDVFGQREQYLNAREALTHMLEVGVVPVVNENDAVVVDELRFGDNDRLAAIVSQIVNAGLLVLLTDTKGLFSDDPNLSPEAQLLTAVRHSDRALTVLEGSSRGGRLGSGGVATKVAAAQMAAWSGIPTVVADATEEDVALRAVRGDEVGTWVSPRHVKIPARKLWIAFGMPTAGQVEVDPGAVSAIVEGGSSLLAAGVTGVHGDFGQGSAVEIVGETGVAAKGITRLSAREVEMGLGQHSSVVSGEVVHRDDLLVLVESADHD